MVKARRVRDESFSDPDETTAPTTTSLESLNKGGRPRLKLSAEQKADHWRKQLRRAWIKYKEKLKSAAAEDAPRKVRHQQRKRMRLAIKNTPEHVHTEINAELNKDLTKLIGKL